MQVNPSQCLGQRLASKQVFSTRMDASIAVRTSLTASNKMAGRIFLLQRMRELIRCGSVKTRWKYSTGQRFYGSKQKKVTIIGKYVGLIRKGLD